MKRIIQRVSCIFAMSIVGLTAGCSDDGPAVDAAPVPDAPPEVGTLSLEWSVENAGTPLTCAQVGGISVRVTATPIDGGFATPEAFSCDSESGNSMEIDSGTYNVSIELVASGNQSLGAPQVFQNVEIMTEQNTPLGSVVFDVVPAGSLEFTIDAQEAGGNCETVANGGAELQEVEIQVLDSNGLCVSTSFSIAAGANLPAGTYDADCAGTRYLMCIDNDQVLHADDIPAGTTSMVITGYRGGTACYSRMPQFGISGGGLLTTLLPQLLMPTGDCDV